MAPSCSSMCSRVLGPQQALRLWLGVAIVLIVILLLGNGGLIALTTAIYKDTYVKGDTTLSNAKGQVVGTRAATHNLPLLVARSRSACAYTMRPPSFARDRPPSLKAAELASLSAAVNQSNNASMQLTVLSRADLQRSPSEDRCTRLQGRLPQLRILLGVNASAASAGGWALGLPQPHRAHHAAALLALPHDGLVLLSGRLLVLRDGLVASLAPPHALFDLSGGCCRPRAITCWSGHVCSASSESQQWLQTAARRGLEVLTRPHWAPHWSISWLCTAKCALQQREPSYRAAASVYLLTHSHSGSYYHALIEALPRLLFGLALLRSHTAIQIVHDSPRTMPPCLHALGLGGRDLLAPTDGDPRPLLASSVVVPPPRCGSFGRCGSVVQVTSTLLRYGTLGQAAAPALGAAFRHEGAGGVTRGVAPEVTLLVRRSLSYDDGNHARAITNHRELHAALKRWLDDAAAPSDAKTGDPKRLVVFEPSGVSLPEVVRLWATASLVIAPHGAGLANIIFCAPGATVVELFRGNVPHSIYQSLSATFGLRYVGCKVPVPTRADKDTAGTSNFVLNLTWFFAVCLEGHGVRANERRRTS